MNCPGQWYLWVFAVVLAWCTVLGQEVDLNFSTENCIAQNQRNNVAYSETVNGVVPSGCTIALLCQYRSCPSTKRKSTNLRITLNDAMLDEAIVVIRNSSCVLKVFITNLTVEFHKKEVRCNKRDNQEVTLQKRTLEVGYPPPRPRNLTVEYHPHDYIHLWLDPVQSAQDLNDYKTKWSVNYFWRSLNQCQNFTATSRSRHLACNINLTGLLSEDNMYAGHGGSTTNNITFSVNVSNKFGWNSISRNFSLMHFIKPSRVNATLVTAGSSWLFIKASLDSTMFKYCTWMKSSRGNQSLRVEYTVHSVSEADDQELRTEREQFHKTFGFYRNLPDDEAALVYLNATSYLPHTKEQKWNCKNQTMDINVTNLEPYSHYRISFCLLGKYRGPETTDTYGTSDDKPLHPPKFGISPYYCFTGDQDTVSCAIYFQEIPRVLRRATVSSYTLEGFTAGNGHHGNIPGCRNFTERADGQNNSLVVKNLSPDCVYIISLTAETQLGPSPPATQILDAKDIGKLVDVEVVLENSTAYTVYWNSANWAQGENISYYIHYCYTTKAETFKCMTNLVTRAANNSLSYSKIVLTPYAPESPLTPTFFVSAAHNGKTIGMVKEKWRYCTDKAATEIRSLIVTRSDSDPTNLEVRFQRADTDSSDCKGGRPTHFVISWTECSNGCNKKEDSKSMNFQIVNAYRKDPIILRGLNQSTTYCVWVKAQGNNGNSSSVCESATTARSPEVNFASIIVAGILIVLTIFVTAACVSICFYCRKVKAKVRRIHVDWPKPRIKQTEAVTRPAVHSSFHTFTKLSAGPGHILSGDSGIDDEGVDAAYEKSLLTANGEDRSCSEQAKTVHNRARDCGGQQFPWSSGSTQPSQLHTEQENELFHKSRYQPAARAPSCSSAECDEEEEDGDEEEESLIESEEEESLSEKEETELSDVSLKRSECSFVNCPSFDMQTALAKLPEALFQQSGPEPRGLKPRAIMSSSEESAEESDR